MTGLESYAILDFEACGLSDDGWPIEVGLSLLRDGRIEIWSSLIRPEDDWDEGEWSEDSAEIHGIARADLDYAPPAAEVARQLLERVEGWVVLSDALGYERLWLNRLLDVIGRRGSVTVEDYRAATASIFGPEGLERVQDHLDSHPVPHRAGEDTERMLRAWLSGDPGRT